MNAAYNATTAALTFKHKHVYHSRFPKQMRTFERMFGSIHPNIKKVIDMNFSTLRYYTDHDWIRDEWFYHTQVLTEPCNLTSLKIKQTAVIDCQSCMVTRDKCANICSV